MTKLSIVGIDLAKSVFQLHGIDADGGCCRPEEDSAARAAALAGAAAAVPGRDGSVRHVSSLGAPNFGARPSGAADPSVLRQALREAGEERPQRCRRHLRGRGPAHHALRRDEDAGSASRAGPASEPRAARAAKNHARRTRCVVISRNSARYTPAVRPVCAG